ncbi:MAG: hypothetical protein WCS69_01025 [Ignavibacteriaceae bacterium]|jgi:hypothetical protein
MIFPTSSNQPKKGTGNFRTIFVLLFALAIFLMFLNILLSFFTPKQQAINTSEISSSEINSLFLKSVSEFYLNEKLLQKIKSPYKKEDSLVFSYSLTLPYDVPTPVFLQSVFEDFTSKSVSISSIDAMLDKKLLLKISSGGKIKFYTEIIQDTSLHRDNGSIAFILTNYENMPDEELKKLLRVPENFAFLLQPKNESVEFSKIVLDARKEYLVELTESSPNPEFTLAENFPFLRNKLAINSLIKNYPNNAFFFVNAQSTLLSSNAYSKVRKEFAKRKVTLYSTNVFTNLSDLNNDELTHRFSVEVQKLETGETKVMLLPASYFNTSIDIIKNVKKRGILFIPVSTAVKRLKGK